MYRQQLRKGMSIQESLALPITTFNELMIFDEYIEPQGPIIDDVRHAITQANICRNSPNMKIEGIKKIKASDHRMIKDKVFKSQEEMKEQAEIRRQNQLNAIMSKLPPDQAARVKQKIKTGVNNGSK